MTDTCTIKGRHLVCPECGRMVPDACGKADAQLWLPLEAVEGVRSLEYRPEAAPEAQEALEESEATQVAEEAPKRRGRPPKGS